MVIRSRTEKLEIQRLTEMNHIIIFKGGYKLYRKVCRAQLRYMTHPFVVDNVQDTSCYILEHVL